MPLVRWFLSLPTHRKILFFLAGGMLTLVWDAFIAHFGWSSGTMKWNQWPPVIYGLGATLALFIATFWQLDRRTETKLLLTFGALGLLVGGAGVTFHVLELVENIDPEDLSLRTLGNTIADSPPVFAPAAFAGVGLLLMVLKRITGAHRAEVEAAASGTAPALAGAQRT